MRWCGRTTACCTAATRSWPIGPASASCGSARGGQPARARLDAARRAAARPRCVDPTAEPVTRARATTLHSSTDDATFDRFCRLVGELARPIQHIVKLAEPHFGDAAFDRARLRRRSITYLGDARRRAPRRRAVDVARRSEGRTWPARRLRAPARRAARCVRHAPPIRQDRGSRAVSIHGRLRGCGDRRRSLRRASRCT